MMARKQGYRELKPSLTESWGRSTVRNRMLPSWKTMPALCDSCSRLELIQIAVEATTTHH